MTELYSALRRLRYGGSAPLSARLTTRGGGNDRTALPRRRLGQRLERVLLPVRMLLGLHVLLHLRLLVSLLVLRRLFVLADFDDGFWTVLALSLPTLFGRCAAAAACGSVGAGAA